jgi:hypothetical protein
MGRARIEQEPEGTAAVQRHGQDDAFSSLLEWCDAGVFGRCRSQ